MPVARYCAVRGIVGVVVMCGCYYGGGGDDGSVQKDECQVGDGYCDDNNTAWACLHGDPEFGMYLIPLPCGAWTCVDGQGCVDLRCPAASDSELAREVLGQETGYCLGSFAISCHASSDYEDCRPGFCREGQGHSVCVPSDVPTASCDAVGFYTRCDGTREILCIDDVEAREIGVCVP